MLLRLIVLLVILVPAIELWGIITVGRFIGAGPTVLIIILTGILGGYFAKQQGWQTLRLAQIQLNRGELPTEALLDGVCILAGGVLLITPGFITDLIGVLLLIPLTRGIIKLWTKAYLLKKIRSGGRIIWYRR